MWGWIGGMGCALFCFLVGYRAGHNAAEKASLRAQIKANENMDKIMQRNSTLTRDELLDKLRRGTP